MWDAITGTEGSTQTRVDTLSERLFQIKPVVYLNVHLKTQNYARQKILDHVIRRILANESLRYEQIVSRFSLFRSHLVGVRYQTLNHLVNRPPKSLENKRQNHALRERRRQ